MVGYKLHTLLLFSAKLHLFQNVHGCVAILVEGEVEGAEGAVLVEICEIYLVGEVGYAPVALLCGVPTVARVTAK